VFLRAAYVVPVIMYHHIDENSQESKLSVSPESLERQMRFLRKNNYNIVSLRELAELMKNKRRIPYKTIAVTFDDGYKDNYTNAFPILKKYQIPACIFVVVGKIGKQGYLNSGDIEEMLESNIDIASHTVTECYLPDIKDEEALRHEIWGSRRILKSRFKNAGDFIAYCSGGFNKKIRQMVIDAGYEGACATNPGSSYPDDDVYAIKRLRISRTSDNMFVFWIETSGWYTWIKEHRDED
jgi:peptidoglycan/xylan/chitin deacetylase (PgdA/CDA1 family)